MTIEELLAREEIRRTLAAYNIAGDRARAEELAATFTEDGILEVPGARHEGRDTILQWIRGIGRSSDAAEITKATFVRHHITTCHIELTGRETATARTYFAVFTDIGPDHCGFYSDIFRKEGDRWLITHRKARLDWKSPQSTFTA